MNILQTNISDAELKLMHDTGMYLPVKMAEIRTLTINVKQKDGSIKQLIIHPKQVWYAFNEALNDLRGNNETSFLRDYIAKPVVFALGAKTALTDGSRIVFCPVFAQVLWQLGNRYFNNEKRETLQKQYPKTSNDPEYNRLSNQTKLRYILYILVHEAYHIIYMHVKRTLEMVPKITTPSERILANCAADLEINRDIEATFPRFEGCTKALDGQWFLDEQWLNPKTNKPLNKEVFEQIYKIFMDNINEQILNAMNKARSQKHLPQSVQLNVSSHSKIYSKGWDDAHTAIKDNIFDPMTVNI